MADTLPSEQVTAIATEFFHGECPRCHQTAKGVDIRRHHRLLSAVFFQTYGTGQSVCCRSCATKMQLGSLGFTFLLGWWSPRGIFMTPIWIGKNVVELIKTVRREPSRELTNLLAQNEAQKLIEEATIASPYVRRGGI